MKEKIIATINEKMEMFNENQPGASATTISMNAEFLLGAYFELLKILKEIDYQAYIETVKATRNRAFEIQKIADRVYDRERAEVIAAEGLPF